MEAGLMEIVRSLNRNWIYDTFPAYIELFIRGSPGDLSDGGKCPDTRSKFMTIELTQTLSDTCSLLLTIEAKNRNS